MTVVAALREAADACFLTVINSSLVSYLSSYLFLNFIIVMISDLDASVYTLYVLVYQ